MGLMDESTEIARVEAHVTKGGTSLRVHEQALRAMGI